MTDEQEKFIIGVAEKIAKAIKKKFPKHNVYVRRHSINDIGYIELAMAPVHSRYATQEIVTAYSDEYFLGITKENIQERARRIYEDFRAHVVQ